ncbi:hypothetical protein MA16_Dca029089 [Dendrobium catenatum]|uniref:Uncharacterized protein n=1 Tax=Dendrobium catenatum TaxID=906689 RepID=A0A2I0VE49_9ASPA|nr:hypothetical protein MA16_Dca029089 [Dendrobium catenatum]
MSHSFFIPTWVLFFLITSSLTIQFQFANGDIVEEKGRRLKGRTGISPPAPATNTINHFSPLKGPGCGPDTAAAPPDRTNEGKFK